MGEVYIILKSPDDGDPLDMGIKHPEPRADTMTVGVKFKHSDGKFYGNYVYLPIQDAEKAVNEATNWLLKEALETARTLNRRDGRQA